MIYWDLCIFSVFRLNKYAKICFWSPTVVSWKDFAYMYFVLCKHSKCSFTTHAHKYHVKGEIAMLLNLRQTMHTTIHVYVVVAMWFFITISIRIIFFHTHTNRKYPNGLWIICRCYDSQHVWTLFARHATITTITKPSPLVYQHQTVKAVVSWYENRSVSMNFFTNSLSLLWQQTTQRALWPNKQIVRNWKEVCVNQRPKNGKITTVHRKCGKSVVDALERPCYGSMYCF